MSNLLYQRTAKNMMVVTGMGLHTGVEGTMYILPEPPDFGLKFLRIDLEDPKYIEANFRNVVDTHLCTTLGNSEGQTVSTVEHLMYALYATGLDNVTIVLDMPEVPALDGSARSFITLILESGMVEYAIPKKRLLLNRNLGVRKDDDEEAYVISGPSLCYNLRCKIDYEDDFIGKDKFVYYPEKDEDLSGISYARTFGRFEDLEKLHKQGKALGASLDNVVGINDNGVMNEHGLRYKGEFVRHKMLDFMGDMFLCGYYPYFSVEISKGGHKLHFEFLEEVFSRERNYRIVSALDPVFYPRMDIEYGEDAQEGEEDEEEL